MIENKWQQHAYAAAARDIAPALLGRYLVHKMGKKTLVGRIVETEAYGGVYRRQRDDGSHAFHGLTSRTEPMFWAGGWSYVYLIYGMYCCMNIVTGSKGDAQAVLIRAVEPISGLDEMLKNRGASSLCKNLTNGPGKLCRALDIDLRQNKLNLCGDELYVMEPMNTSQICTCRSTRININYAVKGKYFPWRFYIKGNPYVSRF
ncbi:MAG: DNA-3-methyladenine glycosylase [Megasphaera sp.]|jgi:DNA-3-methyladenine glycosylase|uniref:DNA-3-methyladenine glycosylase n=1 Tax=Megasphaera sueciensis TaxID=349094 RepID=UPI003D00D931|nr:DNA-3-methyladenine glycosylase [Megasphaera sp.]MCI1823228.1 DNA-3-methyladenine glycosylase [Megasphaera sp.]